MIGVNSGWNGFEKNREPVTNEIHVWRIDISSNISHLASFQNILSPDECSRADRFRFGPDRNSYIITRGALRFIFGTILGKRPETIGFIYGKNGKPSLNADPETACLNGGKIKYTVHFNVSHSRNLSLIAVSRRNTIGVDIQYMGFLKNDNRIAENFFSRDEVIKLRSLPEAMQQQAFFTCWTRKEAFIKAKGGGLTIPLEQFSVQVTPGEPAQLLKTDWDPDEASRWRLMDLDIDEEYAAALVVENRECKLKYLNFNYFCSIY